jgi:hypothetical protein
VFDQWRAIAESAQPAYCPSCQAVGMQILLPPMVLATSLRLKQETKDPQLVKRQEKEPAQPRLQSHPEGRPWMISH